MNVTLNIKMGGKNRSSFDHGMIGGARQTALSISETAHLLGISHTTASGVFFSQNSVEKKTVLQTENRVLMRGHRRMVSLAGTYRKGNANSDNHSFQTVVSRIAQHVEP